MCIFNTNLVNWFFPCEDEYCKKGGNLKYYKYWKQVIDEDILLTKISVLHAIELIICEYIGISG